MFLYIYIQPMWRLSLTALGAMILYGGFICLMKRKGLEQAAERLTAVLWCLWLIAVLWVTLRRGGGSREVCLIPFRNIYLGFTKNVEMFRTMFMNVLLFLPGGYLGAVVLKEKKSRKQLLMGLLLLSLAIECIQLVFGLGKTELDDLICNGFGVFLGLFFWGFLREKILSRF